MTCSRRKYFGLHFKPQV